MENYNPMSVQIALEAANFNVDNALKYLRETSEIKDISNNTFLKKSISKVNDIVTLRNMNMAFLKSIISNNPILELLSIDIIRMIIEYHNIRYNTIFYIRDLFNKTNTIEIPVFSPICTWKTELSKRINIEPYCISIILGGKSLDDYKTALDYDLKNENAPYLIIRNINEEDKQLILKGFSYDDIKFYKNIFSNNMQIVESKLNDENYLLSLGHNKTQIRRFMSDTNNTILDVINLLKEKQARDLASENEIARILHE